MDGNSGKDRTALDNKDRKRQIKMDGNSGRDRTGLNSDDRKRKMKMEGISGKERTGFWPQVWILCLRLGFRL